MENSLHEELGKDRSTHELVMVREMRHGKFFACWSHGLWSSHDYDIDVQVL